MRIIIPSQQLKVRIFCRFPDDFVAHKLHSISMRNGKLFVSRRLIDFRPSGNQASSRCPTYCKTSSGLKASENDPSRAASAKGRSRFIPIQNFDHAASAVAESEEVAGESVESHNAANHGRQAVDGLAHIDVAKSNVNFDIAGKHHMLFRTESI